MIPLSVGALLTLITARLPALDYPRAYPSAARQVEVSCPKRALGRLARGIVGNGFGVLDLGAHQLCGILSSYPCVFNNSYHPLMLQVAMNRG